MSGFGVESAGESDKGCITRSSPIDPVGVDPGRGDENGAVGCGIADGVGATGVGGAIGVGGVTWVGAGGSTGG